MTNNTIAVLTADLVDSTHMSSSTYHNVIQQLNSYLSLIASEHKGTGELYRGDAFQIQFTDPFAAIKTTLLIKLGLYTAEYTDQPVLCTMSLAYGQATDLANTPNISSGPVFVASGRQLDEATSGQFSLCLPPSKQDSKAALLSAFINHHLNKLTKSQAQLLYLYIESDFAEHKKIADKLGTSRQNISNRLSSMGATLIRDYIQLVNQQLN